MGVWKQDIYFNGWQLDDDATMGSSGVQHEALLAWDLSLNYFCPGCWYVTVCFVVLYYIIGFVGIAELQEIKFVKFEAR